MDTGSGLAVMSATEKMTNLTVCAVSYQAARQLVESRHYLGQMRKSGVQIGLWQNGELVGVAVFGQPSREGVAKALWDIGDLYNTTELLRFYTNDGVEPWLGTWFLSRAVKQLPPWMQMIVAFSDPVYGHHGGLYQAASWLYTGQTTNTPYHYEDADGNRVGKSTPWKQARRERLAGLAPADERPADGERRVAAARGWRRVPDLPKHRYVYARTRKARRMLRFSVLPYPKPDRLP